MKMNRNMVLPASVAAAMVAFATSAHATLITTPVTGWEVHNGTSVVTDGGTDFPTFTPGDNITVMAPFSDITLANDGDYVTASVNLTMASRSTTGVNTLNTQLRIGLFNGPPGAVVANDIPNTGFIIEYTNAGAGGLIREQTSLTQTAPFNSPINIGNGVPDAESESISGANPQAVLLELTLTRNAGELDLTGQISSGSYLSTYSVASYSSATHPLDGEFNFNRIGLFLGDGVNAASASLSDAKVITNVPEPTSYMLAAMVAAGGVLIGRRKHGAPRRRNRPPR
jgi:hypothetical protein